MFPMLLLLLSVQPKLLPASLPDQFGQDRALDKEVHWVVIAFERKSGKVLRQWLRTKPAGFLAERGGAVIVDITTMKPDFYYNTVLPRLMKYEHPILIVKDLAAVPREPEALTLITFDDKGEVLATYHPTSPEALEEVLP